MGPRLLESAYQLALKRELELRGLKVIARVPVELVYKDLPLGKAYEIDLLVEEEIIIENKSVDTMPPVFIFQVITYLRLYHQKKLGYLINFNVQYLKDGFKRIVNNFLSLRNSFSHYFCVKIIIAEKIRKREYAEII